MSWVDKVFSKRVLTAAGGLALVAAGVITGNVPLATIGAAIFGREVPSAKELQIVEAAKGVLKSSPRTEQSDPAIQRLRRVTGAPPER